MLNVVYYANCQARGLDFFLKLFLKNINTNHIENYTFIKNNKKIPYNILKEADIFISK